MKKYLLFVLALIVLFAVFVQANCEISGGTCRDIGFPTNGCQEGEHFTGEGCFSSCQRCDNPGEDTDPFCETCKVGVCCEQNPPLDKCDLDPECGRSNVDCPEGSDCDTTTCTCVSRCSGGAAWWNPQIGKCCNPATVDSWFCCPADTHYDMASKKCECAPGLVYTVNEGCHCANFWEQYNPIEGLCECNSEEYCCDPNRNRDYVGYTPHFEEGLGYFPTDPCCFAYGGSYLIPSEDCCPSETFFSALYNECCEYEHCCSPPSNWDDSAGKCYCALETPVGEDEEYRCECPPLSVMTSNGCVHYPFYPPGLFDRDGCVLTPSLKYPDVGETVVWNVTAYLGGELEGVSIFGEDNLYSNSASVSHVYNSSGLFSAFATVFSSNKMAVCYNYVNVGGKLPPVCTVSATCGSASSGKVTCDINVSAKDLDGKVSLIDINFGDADTNKYVPSPLAADVNYSVLHQFAVPTSGADYNVVAKVTDVDGNAGICFYNFTVAGGKVNASCGDANRVFNFGETFPGNYNLCATGNPPSPAPSGLSPSNPVSWVCLGLNTGANANCSASMKPAIQGVCKTDSQECESGQYSKIDNNSSHYLWNCVSLDPTKTVSCSLPKPVSSDKNAILSLTGYVLDGNIFVLAKCNVALTADLKFFDAVSGDALVIDKQVISCSPTPVAEQINLVPSAGKDFSLKAVADITKHTVDCQPCKKETTFAFFSKKVSSSVPDADLLVVVLVLAIVVSLIFSNSRKKS